jgi:hypothetical protein
MVKMALVNSWTVQKNLMPEPHLRGLFKRYTQFYPQALWKMRFLKGELALLRLRHAPPELAC